MEHTQSPQNPEEGIIGEDCHGCSGQVSGQVPACSLPGPSHTHKPSSLSLSTRPFQRTVTMHKDSSGQVGFFIKKGKIVSVVKGSSAARNGLLTNHYVCEVNGQNVIGLKVGSSVALLGNVGTVEMMEGVEQLPSA